MPTEFIRRALARYRLKKKAVSSSSHSATVAFSARCPPSQLARPGPRVPAAATGIVDVGQKRGERLLTLARTRTLLRNLRECFFLSLSRAKITIRKRRGLPFPLRAFSTRFSIPAHRADAMRVTEERCVRKSERACERAKCERQISEKRARSRDVYAPKIYRAPRRFRLVSRF